VIADFAAVTSSIDTLAGKALELASGTVAAGPRWDTGVAAHPGGGLVATLCSDQGATN
jgi:hypothetical protein